MTQLSPNIQADFTNQILSEWAKEVYQILIGQLREKVGHVPSSTAKNLAYKILMASASDVSARFQLFFQDSGRHVDMKRLQPGDVLPVDVIRAWVKRQGIQAFRKIPGYSRKRSARKLSNAQKIDRIASSIAISKSKGTVRKGKKRSRSRWLNPYFYSYYFKLIGRFISRQADFLKKAIISETTEALTQKNNG